MKEYNLIINGNSYNVVINELEDTLAEVEVNGTPFQVTIDKPLKKSTPAPSPRAQRSAAPTTAKASHSSPKSTSGNSYTVNSPLPGVILEVSVKEGDTVTGCIMAGQAAALVKETLPAKEIIHQMFAQARELLNAAPGI